MTLKHISIILAEHCNLINACGLAALWKPLICFHAFIFLLGIPLFSPACASFLPLLLSSLPALPPAGRAQWDALYVSLFLGEYLPNTRSGDWSSVPVHHSPKEPPLCSFLQSKILGQGRTWADRGLQEEPLGTGEKAQVWDLGFLLAAHATAFCWCSSLVSLSHNRRLLFSQSTSIYSASLRWEAI